LNEKIDNFQPEDENNIEDEPVLPALDKVEGRAFQNAYSQQHFRNIK